MSRGDKWLSDYERACSKADEAQAAINERDRLARTGQNASKVTSQIRRLLNELAMNVQSLEDSVNIAGREYHITDAEFNRRQNLVATLKGRRDDLQGNFSRESGGGRGGGGGGGDGGGGYGEYGRYGDSGCMFTEIDTELSPLRLNEWLFFLCRNELFGGPESGDDRRRTFEESDATRGYDSHELLARQQTVMRDQDKGLDILQQSIARQKNMGLAIGNEIDDQNDMLDELGEAMDNTDHRLTRETQHVIRVTEKAKSGGMCCCIVLLIIAIIAVGAVG
eukprot:m.30567 g.30567  ORF g.30567 m.30567 type:complete len:279 (+) comp13875_c0_seq1:172-1008(+)